MPQPGNLLDLSAVLSWCKTFFVLSEYMLDADVGGFYIGGYQPHEGTDVQEFIWLDGSLWHEKPFGAYDGEPVIDPDRRCLAGHWQSNQFYISNQLCNHTDYGSVCKKSSCKLLMVSADNFVGKWLKR